MKILAVSDIESDLFYEYYRPGRLKGYDLIISCGDLKTEYLEFLVTMASCPLFYVHGNHDEINTREPEGCLCIDDKLVVYQGLRIVGLGGSYSYRKGEYMYTESQMRGRVFRLWPSITIHKGIDILVTHAPARGLNDSDSLSHRGFECFNYILDKYSPELFLHGHVHLNYGMKVPRQCSRGSTKVINAFDHFATEIREESEDTKIITSIY